jgi:hypothetical protein
MPEDHTTSKHVANSSITTIPKIACCIELKLTVTFIQYNTTP